MRRCFKFAQGWLLLLTLVCGCSKGAKSVDKTAYYAVDAVHLLVPKIPDWTQDPTAPPFDSAKGGLALRLIMSSAVAGSPRIDVVVEAPHDRPTLLEDFLTRNLQEMGKLESAGQIQINKVEQGHVGVGSKAAYRVRHEYTVGTGGGLVALNQVSTFVVLEGRGVSITGAGRTELFHPQADTVERLMSGLRVENDRGPAADSINLGKIGGASK